MGSERPQFPSRLIFKSFEGHHKRTNRRWKCDIGYERFLGPEIFFNPEIFNPQYNQSLPEVVRANGAVYVFSTAAFMASGTLATRSIGAIEMSEEHSVDIDTFADLQRAEDLFLQRSFSKAG